MILKLKNTNFTNIKTLFYFILVNIDVNKIVVSNKISFGKKKDFKYFIGYKDAKKIDLMYISSKNEFI